MPQRAPVLERKYEKAYEDSPPNATPDSNVESSMLAMQPLAPRPVDANLICTEIDADGNLVNCTKGGSKLVSKSSICALYGLQPRDLRKLDGTLKDQLPVILVRSSAVLLNLGVVKAIIRHDGVTLFESMDVGERLRQQEFIQEIQAKLVASNTSGNYGMVPQQPFEFVVLETILQKTLQELQEDFDRLHSLVEEHLATIQGFVQWERLKILLTCKMRATLFQERVNSIRSCISEILESDDDMAGMYLSHKALLSERSINAHEEIELLLESYLKTAEEIASRLQVLIADMQSTEDIVNIGLVGQRNELLLLELKLGIGTFAASMGGFGASVLGMNIPNHMEHSPYAFGAVLGGLLTVAGTAFLITWRRLLCLIRKH